MSIYTVPMHAVAVSQAQDLWHIKAGAAYPLILHHIELDQKGLIAVEAREVRIKRHTVTVTQGSGGSAATPAPHAPGGASSGVTARMNDTTQASAGTITTLLSKTWQLLNGWFYMPAPEDRLYFAPGTGIIVDLPNPPSGPMTVSGFITWEEIGL